MISKLAKDAVLEKNAAFGAPDIAVQALRNWLARRAVRKADGNLPQYILDRVADVEPKSPLLSGAAQGFSKYMTPGLHFIGDALQGSGDELARHMGRSLRAPRTLRNGRTVTHLMSRESIENLRKILRGDFSELMGDAAGRRDLSNFLNFLSSGRVSDDISNIFAMSKEDISRLGNIVRKFDELPEHAQSRVLSIASDVGSVFKNNELSGNIGRRLADSITPEGLLHAIRNRKPHSGVADRVANMVESGMNAGALGGDIAVGAATGGLSALDKALMTLSGGGTINDAAVRLSRSKLLPEAVKKSKGMEFLTDDIGTQAIRRHAVAGAKGAPRPDTTGLIDRGLDLLPKGVDKVKNYIPYASKLPSAQGMAHRYRTSYVSDEAEKLVYDLMSTARRHMGTDIENYIAKK